MKKQEDTSVITERLIISREKMGMNRSEAADYLNLSKMGYHRYESGERMPSFQTLTYIAQKFNTSVDYLTGKTDISKPDQIVVEQNADPDLYGLVDFYLYADDNNKNRLITYYRRLSK